MTTQSGATSAPLEEIGCWTGVGTVPGRTEQHHGVPASGLLDEMGWTETEQDGCLERATSATVLLLVGGVYWGSIWLLSGMSPLAYLASRIRPPQRSDVRGRVAEMEAPAS